MAGDYLHVGIYASAWTPPSRSSGESNGLSLELGFNRLDSNPCYPF